MDPQLAQEVNEMFLHFAVQGKYLDPMAVRKAMLAPDEGLFEYVAVTNVSTPEVN